MQISSKNIQSIIKSSKSLDSTGKGYYKDVFSLPIKLFNYNSRPVAYTLTEKDVYRFDLLILNFYGQIDYYIDMILWLNDIPFLTDKIVNRITYFPTKTDLDSFYKTYFVDVV